MALLAAHGISKRFPGVLALDAVDMAVEAGEVLAVIGENGAGKSTLMKILAGIETPDSGEIVRDGESVIINSPRRAAALGIALIHQELNFCANLSVAANLYLGREPQQWGLIDRATIREGAVQALAQLELEVSPDTLMGDLPIGHQQLVEIAKALSTEARILIMDEPTSSLTSQEAEALFAVINELRERGVAIIYISHRLGEVEALADRVLVLCDGQNAGELACAEISHDAMVAKMVGRDVAQYYAHESHPAGDIAPASRGLGHSCLARASAQLCGPARSARRHRRSRRRGTHRAVAGALRHRPRARWPRPHRRRTARDPLAGRCYSRWLGPRARRPQTTGPDS